MNKTKQATALRRRLPLLQSIWSRAGHTLLVHLLVPVCGMAQIADADSLKRLSLEELMDVEVTSVSRSPQRLSEVASAIQVITAEDIRRSGATSVPEALRLAPNLQVAQVTSSSWIISARGFNTIFANKLLVMIDGRTVYTPLYGGVIWDLQHVLLEDVDRIEVVSGPGGTQWGVNAVNGVINIITKNRSQTEGLYASVAGGTYLKQAGAVRYGGKLGNRASYKVYGQHQKRDATRKPNGQEYADAWELNQAGFRTDWNASAKDALTFQGDWYWGKRHTPVAGSPLNGQNVLGRWVRTFSESSDLMLQLYYDRYYRDDAEYLNNTRLNTLDADFQHRFGIKNRQSIVWGFNYRVVRDRTEFKPAAGVGILPPERSLDLFSGFVQDEIALGKKLKATLGTKLSHNVYSGWELQPSARLAYSATKSTLWGAVSRAVRSPSRYDVDYYLPTTLQPPTVPSVAGGANFVSEKLLAYELGYRLQPASNSFFSIATFYNVYDDVYSVEALPGTLTYQIQNGSEGTAWGVELSGNYRLASFWRLRGGYTYLDKKLSAKKGHNFNPDYLGNDAKHHVLLQSMLDLPLHLQLDITARYLDKLPKTIATNKVPSYTTFDARLAYVHKWLEISVVGQNLAQKHHLEFGPQYIPRSIYAKVVARF